MPNYIYSTLTEDQSYTFYETQKMENRIVNIPIKSIAIKGGANKAQTNNTTLQFITPYGNVTKIEDEDLKLLKTNFHFNEHVKKGFLKIDASKGKIDKKIQDLKPKDRSAPIVPGDLKAKEVRNVDSRFDL